MKLSISCVLKGWDQCSKGYSSFLVVRVTILLLKSVSFFAINRNFMAGPYYLIYISTIQCSFFFILYHFRSFETVSHLALWTKGYSERMLRLLWRHQCCGAQTAEAEGTTLSSHTLPMTCLLITISIHFVKEKKHCF